MALVETKTLVNKISPPLDEFLTNQLVDEFVACERRFVLGDWEPAELNGGQFCEILARIIYHADSKNLNRTKDLSDCIKYIENEQVPHSIQPRHDALHVCVTLKTIYKFRSQRGAVHISPTYKANHLDARFIIECVRWCMNETLRIFWSGDKNSAAQAIRELLQFDVPCVGNFADTILVQRTDLTAEEEILVLLHYAGDLGFSRTEIGRYAMINPPSVTRSLQKLISPALRQAVLLSNNKFRLTDLGQKRIREQMASKLLLG